MHVLLRDSSIASKMQSLFLQSVSGLNNSIRFASDYDSCLTSIQRNTSDFCPVTLLSRPWLEYGNLTRVATVDQQSFHLLTQYEMKTSLMKQETGVLQFIRGFDGSIWLTTAAFVLIFMTFMTLSEVVNRTASERHQSTTRIETWSWIAAVLLKQSGSLPVPACLVNWPSQLLLQHVTAFLLTFYLTSMIKTESVTYGRPDVVDSIDDMIRLGVRPLLTRREYEIYSATPNGSLLKRFADAANHMGLYESYREAESRSLMNTFDGKVAEIASLGHYAQRKRAFNCVRMRLGLSVDDDDLLVKGRLFWNNSFSWLSREQDVNSQMSLLFATRQLPAVIQTILRRRLQWMTESRQTELINRIHFMKRYFHKIHSNAGQKAGVLDCMSNAMQFPDSLVSTMPFSHYRRLLTLFPVVILVISTACLIWEWLYRSSSSRSRRKHSIHLNLQHLEPVSISPTSVPGDVTASCNFPNSQSDPQEMLNQADASNRRRRLLVTADVHQDMHGSHGKRRFGDASGDGDQKYKCLQESVKVLDSSNPKKDSQDAMADKECAGNRYGKQRNLSNVMPDVEN